MLACDNSSPYPNHINNFRFPTPQHSYSSLYHSRDTQKHVMESQRRERIEFLKQREWARRVAEWVRQTNSQQSDFVCPYRILTHQHDLTIQQSSFGRSWPPSPQPVQDASYAYGIPYTAQPRAEQEEPYIIYSSSPSPSFSAPHSDDSKSVGTGLPPSPSSTSVLPKLASLHHRRRSSASTRTPRRSPSLSSIFEVPEED